MAPTLAPRPIPPVAPATPTPEPVLTHSDSEWAAVYPEIKRLYVRERRKLRHVMQHMEKEYGFVATQQMYKKRFSKWGFTKNTKRVAVKPDHCNRISKSKPSKPGDLNSIPAVPSLSEHDSLSLMFLTSVRTWSLSFFETVDLVEFNATHQPIIPTTGQLRQFKTKEASFAFKLVVDLLDRSHGILAGKMARKAFMLVEDMLTLEGPALVWNILEMMYYMVTLHQSQLFQMLLSHVNALAGRAMPESHPLLAMLRGLRRLVSSLTTAASTSDSPSSSSPSSSSTGSSGASASMNSAFFSIAAPEFLRQAWILNAEILLDNFDPRLFPLYFRILWDSCSIPAPMALLTNAKRWFCRMDGYQVPSNANIGHHAMRLLTSTLREEDRALHDLPGPDANIPSAKDYSTPTTNGPAVAREYQPSIPDKERGFDVNGTLSVRMLAVLATAKALEQSPTGPNAAQSILKDVPTIHAAHTACVIKDLIDLNTEQGSGHLGLPLARVEQIRAIVSLRSYTEGETDPQVVREMWLLQDALIAAGEYEEAQEVERDAYRRIEKYTRDIPVDSP